MITGRASALPFMLQKVDSKIPQSHIVGVNHQTDAFIITLNQSLRRELAMNTFDTIVSVAMIISALAYLVLIAYCMANIKYLMIRVHLGMLVDDLFTAKKLKLAAVSLVAAMLVMYVTGMMISFWTMLVLNVVLYVVAFLAKRYMNSWIAAH